MIVHQGTSGFFSSVNRGFSPSGGRFSMHSAGERLYTPPQSIQPAAPAFRPAVQRLRGPERD